MIRDNFLQRKNAVLSRQDKSSIGKLDEKIKSLCDKINSKENLFTTSSCSGRVVIMVDKEEKENGLFIGVWHNKIKYNELKETLKKINKKENIKFKVEPPLLHIICKDMESASELIEKAKYAGFKRSGINAIGKNIVLELSSTEKIEFPIVNNGKILVSDEFLKIIVKQSNEKLEKGWKKIEKLKGLI